MKNKEPKEKGRLGRYAETVIQTTIKPTFFCSAIFLIVLWVIAICYMLLEPNLIRESPNTLHRLSIMVIVLIIITIFSIFPTLIYAVFDIWGKKRGEQKTLADLRHHKYLVGEVEKEIKEAGEQSYEYQSYRIPVLLATYSIIIGWVLFFFSEGYLNFLGLLKYGAFSYIFNNLGKSHPIVFGFMGAYFWSLGTIFHRFLRGDLMANVFVHVVVRIWSVFVLILVLSSVWPSYHQYWILGASKSTAPGLLLAFSFLVGIFPNVGIEQLKKIAKGAITLRTKEEAKEISLNEIQGLSIWDQGKLIEEGIQNVQNLATVDVIGLIVNTRFSVSSILNWVDQAILIIHAKTIYKSLRKSDILTATDLEAIYAGRLKEDIREKINREIQDEQRETYFGCKGITYIGEPDKGLIEAIPKNEQFSIENRLRNIMISICDDVNYQRLWKIRHGRLFPV